MSGCRISRVRMKNGGADVRVLHSPVSPIDDENWGGKMVEHARNLASQGEVLGYVVAAVYADGNHSFGSRIDHDRCAIPRTAWPALMADITRRYLVSAQAAREVIEDEYLA